MNSVLICIKKCPSKIHIYSEPVNRTLFGNGSVFADVINLRRGLGWTGPTSSITGVLTKRGKSGHRYTCLPGERPVKAMCREQQRGEWCQSTSQGCQRLLATTRSSERRREAEPLSRLQKGTNLPIPGFGLTASST